MIDTSPTSRAYSVKEIFKTIQGEGVHSGTAAIFVRLSGCNAWSGLDKHRDGDAASKGKCALVCDTDFVGMDKANGGGRLSASEIASEARRLAFCESSASLNVKWVVLTGGEPLLQADFALVDQLWSKGFSVAVETNGSIRLEKAFGFRYNWPEHICVSPKPPLPVVIEHADEVKVLVPLYDPVPFEDIPADHHFVSPVWDDDEATRRLNNKSAAEFVIRSPKWKLTTQMHKYVGIP